MKKKKKNILQKRVEEIFLDKFIFNYFRLFKKIFKKEVIDFEFSKYFHNFVLKYLKKSDCKIIKKSNLDVFIIFDGLKFIVRDYSIYYDLIRFGSFESTTTNLIKLILKEGDQMLDLGANIGYYTLIASKLIGDKGKIFAFEPDPITFKYLMKNIKINEVKNVKLINKCVTDKNGKITLYHHPKYHTCHSIIQSPLKEAITVNSITLNKQFENTKEKIKFIKMDIEGAEIEALKGMNKVLSENKVKYLLTELNLRLLKGLGRNIREFISLLENNFKKYYLILDEKTSKIIFFRNKNDLLKFLETYYQDNLNLLCIQ